MKILVTGATGNVGAALTRRAVKSGVKTRTAVRNLEKASDLFAGLDVETVHFDFFVPSTYQSALAGVEALFLVAPPGDPNEIDKIVINFIDMAFEQGCKHITFCSARAAAHIKRPLSMHKIERYLENAGGGYTILRPSWFMQNFNTMLANPIKYTKAISLPCGDAKCSFIDVDDIAEIALKTLIEAGHDGKMYTLSGAEALSFADAAQKISSASGQEISYIDIPADAFIGGMQKRGMPDGAAKFLGFLFDLLKQGTEEEVLPDAETILGRKPITFDNYANTHASAWA